MTETDWYNLVRKLTVNPPWVPPSGAMSSTTLLMVASVREAAARSASAAGVRATEGGAGTTDWNAGRACAKQQ